MTAADVKDVTGNIMSLPYWDVDAAALKTQENVRRKRFYSKGIRSEPPVNFYPEIYSSLNADI